MHLFAACPGGYDLTDEAARYRRLGQAVEALISAEHAKWVSVQTASKGVSRPPADPEEPKL